MTDYSMSASKKEAKKFFGNKCTICGITEKEVGTLHMAHYKARSKGGRFRFPMCPNCHAKYDRGLLTSRELKKIGLSQGEYKKYRPLFGKKEKTKKVEREANGLKEEPLNYLPIYHAVNEAEDILKMSSKEFWVIGTTLAYWSEVKRNEVIEAVLKRGIHCRFLLTSPDSEFLETAKQEGIIGAETNKEEIQQTIAYFVKHLKNNTELKQKNLQDRIEIRTFNLPFLYSMAVCDPYSENGMMYVEPYSYDTPKGDRYLLVVRKVEQRKLFDRYLKSFEYALKKSTLLK